MADGTPSPISTERQSDRVRGDEASRGDRSSGSREGGFRIRLSDNEMRSARALQEAFGLRSTVAVLGFALRTLGQQLEEGKLDELAAQHRAQLGPRSGGGTGSARTEGRQRPEGGRSAEGRWQEGRGSGGRAAKVDPFARPSRPAVATQPIEEPSAEACLPEDLPSEFVDVLPPPLDSPDVSQSANAASEEASQTPEE